MVAATSLNLSAICLSEYMAACICAVQLCVCAVVTLSIKPCTNTVLRRSSRCVHVCVCVSVRVYTGTIQVVLLTGSEQLKGGMGFCAEQRLWTQCLVSQSGLVAEKLTVR